MLADRAFALNPPLQTRRLLLEPLVAAHADVLFGLLTDPRIYAWISPKPPADCETLRKVWHRNETRLSPDGSEAWLNWVVRRASDGAYVGRLDASVSSENTATSFGYMFFPEYWGQGYATECSQRMVEHFAHHGVHEVRAYVTLGNAASERVLVKAGFERVRVIPDNDRIRGVLHDDVEYVFRK